MNLNGAAATDKSAHGYLPWYQRHLGPLADSPFTLLEIGVQGGGSLAMWAQWFPRATIIGVDIDPEAARLDDPRVTTVICDIKNYKPLMPLDVVIDDGSHLTEDIVTAFVHLWPFVPPGGFYCIEDWATQAMEAYGGNRRGSAATTVAAGLLWDVLRETDRTVDELHAYPQLLLIRKALR